ncbi:MAG: glycosyltransferase family 4 protein, partial [Verrucomicrobiae bacterium]|nr:glycosyltransferase family 4 protein [Verrucomicrobiae bacterium]
MKICLYNVTSTMDLPGTAEVGGTEEFSFRLGEALQAAGHEVTLVGGEPKAGRSHRPTSLKLKLFAYRDTGEFADGGTRYRKLVQRVNFARSGAIHFVKAESFDLVIAFKPYDLVPFAWSGVRKRSKTLFRFGGTDFFPTDRWHARGADLFFANSDRTAEKVRGRFGRPCAVIPNGVPIPREAASIGNSPGNRTLLAVGRLVGWKGYSDLLLTLSALRHRKGWKLILAGEGPERARLQSLAAEIGVAEKVSLPGRLAEKAIQDILRGGCLFIQPSLDFDSCPNAAMEAMAVGAPVVLSSEVGLPEGFQPDRHGLIFRAGDHQQLFERIVLYLDDPAS